MGQIGELIDGHGVLVGFEVVGLDFLVVFGEDDEFVVFFTSVFFVVFLFEHAEGFDGVVGDWTGGSLVEGNEHGA